MELHTLGVDGGYTQKDVQEVARCFTGWTIEGPHRGERSEMEGRRKGSRKVGTFVFREWMHDEGEKVVLGHRVSSGGIEDGEAVIDLLAHHPNTARFLATKLVQRFVSDDPPKSLVDRVAAVYEKTDGDIRKMLKTIFTSPEFSAPEAYRAKVKSPFELAVSAIRALDGETDGSPGLAQFIGRMGQPLYQCQPPTGYPDRAEQWVNAGALLERLNFGLALSANRIPGTTVDLRRFTAGADQRGSLMDQAIAMLIGGDVSPQTREVLEQQMKAGAGQPGTGRDALNDSPTGATGYAMDDGDAMMNLDADGQDGSGGRAVRRERRAMRGWGSAPARVQPPTDPEVARVFGLVLGLPEFQKR